ncbi:MAG: TolC family protein [Thermodesulfobacteriota bacterium]|nr:TolC family protein [Thermodesulfobacteriota bacterium]
MIVTPITPHKKPRRHFNFSILTYALTAIWMAGFLFLPYTANTTNIYLQDIQTADSFSKNNTLNSKPDILKVYKALFSQTWEQSPEIQIARRLQEQKAAEKYTAWAQRIAPQLDFEITQKQFLNQDSSSDDYQQIFPDTAENNDDYTDGRDVTDWEFDLDIPLYRRTLSVAVDISILEYDLAVNNLDIKTRELDSRLHELLSNYMVACYNLHNLENSIRISGEHVDKIQRGFELRDQTKLALLRAQANLKELEARKDLNEQKRDTTFRELLDYTAIPARNPSWFRLKELLDTEERTAGCINSFSALDTSFETMKLFLENSTTDKKLRDFFVDNSLLYKKILLERDLGKTQAKQYTQHEWPALFVRGEFDRKDDTRFSDYDGEGSIGLVLSIPLFSGGTIFSNVKTQDMSSKIASIQEYSDVLRTFNSIANKKKTITSLQDVYEKQQIHLLQQQEIVRLSLKSYQIKQTSMQDLLTSKNRLIDAKNLLMRTTADLGILLRQFAWELGTPFPAPPTSI